MHPANPFPPHCPYLATSHAGAAGAAEGVGDALVASVVGLGEVTGAAGVAGSLAPPDPFQTAGPGMGYEVAVFAASESMLNAIPGSVLLYAPGKDTRADAGGEAVPEPVTVNWAHSG